MLGFGRWRYFSFFPRCYVYAHTPSLSGFGHKTRICLSVSATFCFFKGNGKYMNWKPTNRVKIINLTTCPSRLSTYPFTTSHPPLISFSFYSPFCCSLRSFFDTCWELKEKGNSQREKYFSFILFNYRINKLVKIYYSVFLCSIFLI